MFKNTKNSFWVLQSKAINNIANLHILLISFNYSNYEVAVSILLSVLSK